VKGQFGIANLLVTDPDGRLPKTPLSLGLQLDAGMTAKVLRLARFNSRGSIRRVKRKSSSAARWT